MLVEGICGGAVAAEKECGGSGGRDGHVNGGGGGVWWCMVSGSCVGVVVRDMGSKSVKASPFIP